MAIDPALYRETLGHYPTGVAVVTAVGTDGGPAGMVVGSFTSVSLDPPLVAFFPTRDSGSFARMRTSSHFCVNVLASDQEATCQIFAGRAIDKFSDVSWQPAPHGSPILEGAVSWIECSFDQILDGGDHHIVLGLIEDLAVSRATLPLLFFQGGYGRFSPPSLVAPSNPDLIHAVRMAELARGLVERLALDHNVDLSLLAMVGSDVVTVMTSEHSPTPTAGLVGQRLPLVPPLGGHWLMGADDDEVADWLDRVRADDVGRRRLTDNLRQVRKVGYSLALRAESDDQRMSLAEDYSSAERLPANDRRIRQLIAERAALYEPVITPDGSYDVESVVAPIDPPPGSPPLSLRLTGLARGLGGKQVLEWTVRLREVAAQISQRIEATNEPTQQPTSQQTQTDTDPTRARSIHDDHAPADQDQLSR